MALKLNGWQRLWIVLSVLYLFLVIALDVIIWPKTTHLEKRYFDETYRLIDEAEGKERKYKRSDLVEEANRQGLLSEPRDEREKLMAGERWVALAERAISKYKDKIDFSKVSDKYERDLREVYAQRKQVVLLSALFWFLPVVALYILGLSVRWIIRGFKQKGDA